MFGVGAGRRDIWIAMEFTTGEWAYSPIRSSSSKKKATLIYIVDDSAAQCYIYEESYGDDVVLQVYTFPP